MQRHDESAIDSATIQCTVSSGEDTFDVLRLLHLASPHLLEAGFQPHCPQVLFCESVLLPPMLADSDQDIGIVWSSQGRSRNDEATASTSSFSSSTHGAWLLVPVERVGTQGQKSSTIFCGEEVAHRRCLVVLQVVDQVRIRRVVRSFFRASIAASISAGSIFVIIIVVIALLLVINIWRRTLVIIFVIVILPSCLGSGGFLARRWGRTECNRHSDRILRGVQQPLVQFPKVGCSCTDGHLRLCRLDGPRRILRRCRRTIR
mmetsp:Transcript_16159/g.34952  ORF Transcript_16159/g.34952 Transcript_16159/m.34952 type:complete len:261 (-) Transcript_16159:1976-2758(-)